MKKLKGMVTVVVVLALVPLLIISLLVVDVARISYSRNIIEESNELVLQAQLSNYNKILKDTYGLFAAKNIDPNSKEFQSKLAKILIDSTNGQLSKEKASEIANDIVSGKIPNYAGEKSSSLSIMPQNFKITVPEGGTLENPIIMKNQILEYMKYRGLISIGHGFFSKIKGFGAVNEEREVVEKKLSYEVARDKIISDLEKFYNDIKYIADNQKKFHDYLNEHEYNMAVDFLNQTKFKTFNKSDPENSVTLSEELKHLKTVISDSKNKKIEVIKKEPDSTTIENNVKKLFKNNFNTGCSLIKKSGEDILSYQDLKDTDFYKVELFKDQLFGNDCKELRELLSSILYYTKDFKSEDGKLSISRYNINDINSLIKKSSDKLAEEIRTEISAKMRPLFTNLIERRDFYEKYRNYLDNSIKALENAEKLISDLQNKKKDWENKNNQLKDGSEFKEKTEKEIVTLASGLKEEHVQKLKKILEDEKKELDKKIQYISNQFFLNLHSDSKEIEKMYVSRIQDPPPENEEDKIGVEHYMIKLESILKNTDESTMLSKITVGGSPNVKYSGAKVLVTENPFYLYVVRVATKFSNKKGETDEKAKELNDLYKSASSIKDTPENQIGGRVGGLFQFDSESNLIGMNKVQELSKNGDGLIGNALKSLGEIGSLVSNLDKFQNFGREVVNTALITEYATEMFTDYLDSHAGSCSLKRTTLLNGKNIKDIYKKTGDASNKGSEVEYILNGHQVRRANIEDTQDRILFLRFGFNLIYSFMDSEINALTTQTSAVAGPFAPLLKAALHVIISFLESKLDIYRMTVLCASIPLYKTPTTWILKPTLNQGQIDLVKSFTEQEISKSVESVFEVLNSNVEWTMDELKNKINSATEDFVDEKIQSTMNMIRSDLQVPIADIIIDLVGGVDLDNLEKKIDEKFSELENVLSKGAFGTVTSAIFKSLKSTLKGEIISKIKENRENPSLILKGLNSFVLKEVQLAVEDQEGVIKSFINEKYGSLKDKVKGKLGEAQDWTKEKIKKEIGSIFEDYTVAAPDKVGAPEKAKGEGLNLNYREYLKIFILIKAFGEEEQVLSRIKNLIQSNMLEMGEADFNFKNYGSIFKIETQYKVNTVLIGNSDKESDLEAVNDLNKIEFWKTFTNTIESVVGY